MKVGDKVRVNSNYPEYWDYPEEVFTIESYDEGFLYPFVLSNGDMFTEYELDLVEES